MILVTVFLLIWKEYDPGNIFPFDFELTWEEYDRSDSFPFDYEQIMRIFFCDSKHFPRF